MIIPMFFQEIAGTEEKLSYIFEEKITDLHEHIENCLTRVSLLVIPSGSRTVNSCLEEINRNMFNLLGLLLAYPLLALLHDHCHKSSIRQLSSK